MKKFKEKSQILNNPDPQNNLISIKKIQEKSQILKNPYLQKIQIQWKIKFREKSQILEKIKIRWEKKIQGKIWIQ